MTSITFFLVFIPLLAIILLAINFIFAPHNPYQEKDSVFECGFHSFLGQNRTQFNISFFIFALLFLLFDLEILLVYPYVVSSYTNGIYGLIIMLVFFLVLTLGFAFEIGKKALTIDSRQSNNSNNNNKIFIKVNKNKFMNNRREFHSSSKYNMNNPNINAFIAKYGALPNFNDCNQREAELKFIGAYQRVMQDSAMASRNNTNTGALWQINEHARKNLFNAETNILKQHWLSSNKDPMYVNGYQYHHDVQSVGAHELPPINNNNNNNIGNTNTQGNNAANNNTGNNNIGSNNVGGNNVGGNNVGGNNVGGNNSGNNSNQLPYEANPFGDWGDDLM